jgi:hypothetical protein
VEVAPQGAEGFSKLGIRVSFKGGRWTEACAFTRATAKREFITYLFILGAIDKKRLQELMNSSLWKK